MIEKLIVALESLGYLIFQRGSLNVNEDYPESFFTFWNFQADENKTFDNTPISCDWGYWLYFYSNDPELIQSELLKAKELLKKNDFEVWGKGEDIKSDSPSHTARMINVYYHEIY